MSIDLFQDVGGEYFPPIMDEPNKYYCLRQDGKVEEVTFDENSSIGKVIENIRGQIRKA
jgi:hypothetical protein